jgi:EAL domain-containing protein (putative c-di-GMP-specific phosphodiesterase class I)
MQQLTALSGGHNPVVIRRTTNRALRGKPLDVSFAHRLHAYEDELAMRESRAHAEAQDLQFLHARLARVQTAFHTDRLVPVFQPIIDLRTRKASGCEALSRFQLEPLRPPDQWFAEAEAAGFGLELEMHAIRSAVQSRFRLPSQTYLSVNVSPKTLLSRDFATLVGDLDGEYLVVEVTEHSAVEDYEALKRAIDQLRSSGVRLAIDDLGTGFASFMHIVKLLPEFMKLDLSLTRGIECDPVKQALTAALVGFAAQIGAHLIAEGVETAEELKTLVGLGVEYAQGYYLGAPAPLALRRVTERRAIPLKTVPSGQEAVIGPRELQDGQPQGNLPRELPDASNTSRTGLSRSALL